MNEPQQPRSLTINHNALVDTLVTSCEVSRAWQPSESQPQPPMHRFTAMWDTGATRSGISQSVVNIGQLRPVGYTTAQTAQGTVENVPVFLVNIRLPQDIVFLGLPVSRIAKPPNADVLIGMDIIGRGDFVVTNADAQTVVSFRIPSQRKIDFLAEDEATQGRQPAETGFITPNPIGFRVRHRRQ